MYLYKHDNITIIINWRIYEIALHSINMTTKFFLSIRHNNIIKLNQYIYIYIDMILVAFLVFFFNFPILCVEHDDINLNN